MLSSPPRHTEVVWSMTEPFPSRSCGIWPFWRSTAFAHRKDGREDRGPHFRGLPHRLAAGQLQNCPHLHQVRGHSFFYLDSCLTLHRSFLSSTFTDMLMERNTLMEYVYPKMKEYCREKHGLEFQVWIQDLDFKTLPLPVTREPDSLSKSAHQGLKFLQCNIWNATQRELLHKLTRL